MRRNKTRILCFIALLCFTASFTLGCTGSNQEPAASQTQTTGTAAGTAESTAAVAESTFDTSPVTLTVYVDHPQLMKSNWGEDDVSKYITEKSGVTLDTQYATNWDGSELLLKITSGDTLPDLIVTDANANRANQLYKEKRVQPLNKLAEQTFPAFMSYLPKSMAEVYSRPDGNLYCVVDWFGDAEKLASAKANKTMNQTILINKPVWEDLGSPAIETLEDFKNVLKQVKSKHSEIVFPLYGDFSSVTNDKDATNLFYRIFGGKDIVYFDAENKLRLCASDPAYKSTLAYLNSLYREKLLSPELFTMAGDQIKAIREEVKLFAHVGQGLGWMFEVKNGLTAESPCYAIPLPTAPNIPRDQIQLKDFNLGTGGWHGTHISTDSKNAKRALEYIAFRYTDDMQIAERYGVEGRGWVKAEDGTPKYSDLKNQMETEKGFDAMSAVLGINNWNHSWFTTNWVVSIGEHHRLTQLPAYGREYEVNAPLAKDERILELSRKINDDEVKVKFEQVMLVWNESVTKMILSNSEADFNQEYEKFLKGIEGAGLKDVETLIQKQYGDWKARLGQ